MRRAFLVRAAALVTSLFVGGAVFAACVEDPSEAPPEDEDVSQSEDAMQVCPGNNVVEGIDVSKYQGNIDWNKVKASGIKFAITRTNDGSYHDEYFDKNWAGIKEVGMIRGAYQFFRPGNDATEQANYFISKVGKLGPGDLPGTLDVEASDGQSKATIVAKIHTWVDLVEKGTGKKPIIYTGKYFWDDNVGSADFNDLPLWHAAYPGCTSPPPGGGCGCPNISNNWNDWAMWQWTSSVGVPGIAGNVDHNVWKGTYESLVGFANAGGYGATILSVHAPTTALVGEEVIVSVDVLNSGGAVWDGNTRIGTTEPRDHDSAFADDTWISAGRVVSVAGSVAPGDTYTFTFTMKAPDEAGTVTEHFGFVQEGVTWFQDSGGPADTDLAITLQTIDGPTPNGVGSGGDDDGGEGGSTLAGNFPDGDDDGAGGGADEEADGELSKPTCDCKQAGAADVRGGGLAAALAIGAIVMRRRRRVSQNLG